MKLTVKKPVHIQCTGFLVKAMVVGCLAKQSGFAWGFMPSGTSSLHSAILANWSLAKFSWRAPLSQLAFRENPTYTVPWQNVEFYTKSAASQRANILLVIIRCTVPKTKQISIMMEFIKKVSNMRTRAECVMKSSAAKHYGCKHARHWSLIIANGRDFSWARNMNCCFAHFACCAAIKLTGWTLKLIKAVQNNRKQKNWHIRYARASQDYLILPAMKLSFQYQWTNHISTKDQQDSWTSYWSLCSTILLFIIIDWTGETHLGFWWPGVAGSCSGVLSRLLCVWLSTMWTNQSQVWLPPRTQQ